LLKKKSNEVINVEDKVEEKCPRCLSPLVIRYSRFGKFLACSRYPQCQFTKSFLKTIAGKKCPRCGDDIVIRFTKSKKRFYGCSRYPQCNWSSWKLNVKT
jgi:DNA topoisomerase-1